MRHHLTEDYQLLPKLLINSKISLKSHSGWANYLSNAWAKSDLIKISQQTTHQLLSFFSLLSEDDDIEFMMTSYSPIHGLIHRIEKTFFLVPLILSHIFCWGFFFPLSLGPSLGVCFIPQGYKIYFFWTYMNVLWKAVDKIIFLGWKSYTWKDVLLLIQY